MADKIATRTETDSFGPIEVPADRYWGAQTQRSRQNFRIGWERMPIPVVRALQRRLLMLAPPQALANPHFENVDIDPGLHRHLVRSMQRLRGRVYLEDGAISERELSADGRHQTPEDDRSWHLLLLDAEQRLSDALPGLGAEHDVLASGVNVPKAALKRARLVERSAAGTLERDVDRAGAQAHGLRDRHRQACALLERVLAAGLQRRPGFPEHVEDERSRGLHVGLGLRQVHLDG